MLRGALAAPLDQGCRASWEVNAAPTTSQLAKLRVLMVRRTKGRVAEREAHAGAHVRGLGSMQVNITKLRGGAVICERANQRGDEREVGRKPLSAEVRVSQRSLRREVRIGRIPARTPRLGGLSCKRSNAPCSRDYPGRSRFDLDA